MHRPGNPAPDLVLRLSIMVAGALTGCHPPGHDGRTTGVLSDSSQLVQLAITEFRRATNDSGPMLVSQFVRSGDSVIIDLAPDTPSGEMTFRGGGRFIVRGRAVVGAQLWQ